MTNHRHISLFGLVVVIADFLMITKAWGSNVAPPLFLYVQNNYY
jgi:hypothetical protein